MLTARIGCRLPPAAMVLLCLAGCSTGSVTPQVDNAMYRRLVPPLVMHVRPFDTSAGIWEGGAAAPNVRSRIRDDLARALADELSELATTDVYMAVQPPTGGWLITGKFVHVTSPRWDSVGPVQLGHGASKIETEVTIFDLAESATDPILVFTTTGGGGHRVGVGVGSKSTHEDASDSDVARTAREIHDYLVEKLSGS